VPIYRLQTELAADSALPRDRMVITPHVNDVGATTDPDNLCQDLAEGLEAFVSGTREIRVTAYDAQGTVPVYPVGTHVVNEGLAPPYSMPREVALCLSFYSERNIPRRRGRLYIPPGLFGIASPGVRPTEANMASVSTNLVSLLTNLGGTDVDWCVFSRADDAAYSVTNWWVDNEWDTVRSRGLRADNRISGTTSEGGI
jgi:hypothetical protein